MFFDTIWEYIVNLIELILFIIFIHTKLHKKAKFKHNVIWIVLFITIKFIAICYMNRMNFSSYTTLLSSCVLDIIYATIFFRDNAILKVFWGFSYSIICLVAEQLTFLIPTALYKGASSELLLGGELRKPFTMLYLAMIAVIILLLHNVANNDITLSLFQKTIYISITILGLAVGHYVLRLTLEFNNKFDDPSFSNELSIVNLFFVGSFLVLLLYIYQLGNSEKENLRLLEEQRIYELERKEFNSLTETTEHLRAIKHDTQIYLDTINTLAKSQKWNELISYTELYSKNLSATHSTVTTGNIAIDCVLTNKLDYAEKLKIKTNYSIMAPENFPLDSVELSSVLGNIWNNSIEACERLLASESEVQPYIYFYIKPYQNMILIHIENNYYGTITVNENEEIISTKHRKAHGIGIRRIKEIVEKADGIIQITYEKNIFSVHIMLPEKENSELS